MSGESNASILRLVTVEGESGLCPMSLLPFGIDRSRDEKEWNRGKTILLRTIELPSMKTDICNLLKSSSCAAHPPA